MKYLKQFMVWISALVFLTACGEQHKAEGIIKDFLKENLVISDYQVVFGKLGTTRKIDQQKISQMNRETFTNDRLFKKPTSYGAYKELPELFYLKTTIIENTDTFVRTLYLHPELRDDGVLAIKEN